MLTYVVRNRTAHGVAAEKILEAEFEVVEKRLFFQLCSVIERLCRSRRPPNRRRDRASLADLSGSRLVQPRLDLRVGRRPAVCPA